LHNITDTNPEIQLGINHTESICFDRRALMTCVKHDHLPLSQDSMTLLF